MSSPRRCPVACTRHVADLASVFGLVLTATSLGLAVYTLYQARSVREEAERLRNRFLFRERASDFLEGIAEFADIIDKQVKRAPLPPHEVRGMLRECNARIQNFVPKFTEEEEVQARSKQLRREIENALEGRAVSRENLQEIYAKLRGLSVAVGELLEDRKKWGHE